MHTYIYAYIHTYKRTYAQTCIHNILTDILKYILKYILKCILKYILTSIHPSIHPFHACMHPYTYTYICICICIYINICIYIYIYTYIYIYIYIYNHIYMYICIRKKALDQCDLMGQGDGTDITHDLAFCRKKEPFEPKTRSNERSMFKGLFFWMTGAHDERPNHSTKASGPRSLLLLHIVPFQQIIDVYLQRHVAKVLQQSSQVTSRQQDMLTWARVEVGYHSDCSCNTPTKALSLWKSLALLFTFLRQILARFRERNADFYASALHDQNSW